MSSSNVNHPSHYNQGGIECIDAIREATKGLDGFEGFCVGNALKYCWRFKYKNGVEDLKKAIWYVEELSEYEGGFQTEREDYSKKEIDVSLLAESRDRNVEISEFDEFVV